ncbi:MAG: TonB-dependent receptor [Bacteroidetes bacterium SB0662_bin_6]|nr:TonB-dependent receptor [Bacteroidetes bacterium SB0668_bin_1]MYE05155.1 TonB-dependent receptor [Bacteroidetes bacterium SB0662_bin_6]
MKSDAVPVMKHAYIGWRAVGLGVVVCLLPFVFRPETAAAQAGRFEVTGVVVDSTGAGLSGATVVALTREDSVLTRFSTTNRDGAFTLRRVPEGAYILQVTYVGFRTHRQDMDLSGGDYDAGTIVLESSTVELDELVVGAEHIPIVVKMDTLEYNAAAFAVRPNDMVEDLLRRLPGVEVEDDGTIRAQGEEVQKVLVEDKEFFGDDPTIATRNLPANVVEKVQVYDKASDMEEFTGIEDGEDVKTINLDLKEEAEKGYFGHVTGGYGSEERYDGDVSVNRFDPSTQLSLIGNVNNVNRQNFSFGDIATLLGGLEAMGGRLILQDGGGLFNNRDGLSETFSVGLNANRDFGANTSAHASYFLSNVDNRQDRVAQQQQLLGPVQSSFVNETGGRTTDNLTHRLTVNALHEFGEGHDLRLRGNLRAGTSSLTNISETATLARGASVNEAVIDYRSESDNLGGNGSLTWRRRLDEKGRSLVGEVRGSLNDNEMSGNLHSITKFLEEGNVLSSDEIMQLQTRPGNSFSSTQRLSYIEPVGTGGRLEFQVESRQLEEERRQSVFDMASGASIFNDRLSSGYDRSYSYVQGGVRYQASGERFKAGIGANLQRSSLEGMIADAVGAASRPRIENAYTHVLPRAHFDYDLGERMDFSLEYSARAREPSVTDLQPLTNNTNPLLVRAGNPALKPEYRHNMNLRFSFYDPFTFMKLFVFARSEYVNNDIVQSRMVDERLRQVITPVNAEGAWMFSGSTHFGMPVRPLGVEVNVANNPFFERSLEYVNEAENRARIFRHTIDVSLNNRNTDLFDIRAGARYTFNAVSYSLNAAQNQQYVNRTYYADATLYLTEKWRVTGSLDYRLYSREVFGDVDSVPILGASIARSVMNERADIELAGFDLLGRNEDVRFSNTNTYIREERIASLGRHILLKFSYRLSPASGAGLKGKGRDIRIDL